VLPSLSSAALESITLLLLFSISLSLLAAVCVSEPALTVKAAQASPSMTAKEQELSASIDESVLSSVGLKISASMPLEA
jgi:Na+-transporting NADH:ubiquinone oxidoreductase subunit NqrC